MEFYTQRIVKTSSDESKKLVKLTPEIKLAMTKIGRGKYKSKTSGIEWGIVDVDGVPHLARLENEEVKEKVASSTQRNKSAEAATDSQLANQAISYIQDYINLPEDSYFTEAFPADKSIAVQKYTYLDRASLILDELSQKLLGPNNTVLSIDSSNTKVSSTIENRRTAMEDTTKTAMQPFGAGEPGPVEHNVEFSDMGENDPTVDMLTMADQFESPESLIAEIAIKYNMSDEEAMSLYEDIKEYVTKFSAILDQRIVTAWCRF